MSDATFLSPLTEHADDLRRLREVTKRHGFNLSMRDACHLWEQVSAPEGWKLLPGTDSELFLVLLEPLHQWLAENGEPLPPPRAEPEGRPLLIDTDQDGPCEICAGWNAVKYINDPTSGTLLAYRCDECGAAIEQFNPMLRMRGCDGVRPHHYHLQGIGPSGIRGRSGVVQELCLECYVVHRQKIYPHESAELIRQKCRNC